MSIAARAGTDEASHIEVRNRNLMRHPAARWGSASLSHCNYAETQSEAARSLLR
jgi:hypothetical protein